MLILFFGVPRLYQKLTIGLINPFKWPCMALRITRNGNQLFDLISFVYQYSISQGKLIIFWSCHLILIVNFPVQKKRWGWFHWFLTFVLKESVIRLSSYFSLYTDSIHHYLLQIFCYILVNFQNDIARIF